MNTESLRDVPDDATPAEAFKAESEGLVEWMRGADVKIGYFTFTLDGEPLVLLVGRGDRADDLTAAYEAMQVKVVYAQSFDPPLNLGGLPHA